MVYERLKTICSKVIWECDNGFFICTERNQNGQCNIGFESIVIRIEESVLCYPFSVKRIQTSQILENVRGKYLRGTLHIFVDGRLQKSGQLLSQVIRGSSNTVTNANTNYRRCTQNTGTTTVIATGTGQGLYLYCIVSRDRI